jgi:hypothetical protein
MAATDGALVEAITGISMNDDASSRAMVLWLISQPSFLTRTGGVL